LHPDDQTILTNWYNSLSDHGSLSWHVGYNLCVQTGITCDNSSPYKRVIKMYFLVFEKSKYSKIWFWIEKFLLLTLGEQFQLNLEAWQIYKLCKNTIPIYCFISNFSPSKFTIINRTLYDMQITGTIPTELGKLINLHYL